MGTWHTYVCGCVCKAYDHAAAGPVSFPPASLSRKSCRDLPVFSFPLEAFPHANKARPAWWNGEEAAFVEGAASFLVCVLCVSVGVCACWPCLTVCYMQIYFWACNSGCSRLLFAHKPAVAREQTYSESHSEDRVTSCLPLINCFNT